MPSFGKFGRIYLLVEFANELIRSSQRPQRETIRASGTALDWRTGKDGDRGELPRIEEARDSRLNLYSIHYFTVHVK